jgi:hypothetical protein
MWKKNAFSDDASDSDEETYQVMYRHDTAKDLLNQFQVIIIRTRYLTFVGQRKSYQLVFDYFRTTLTLRHSMEMQEKHQQAH